MRRNIILGGVYYFDMLKIPPQPKRVGNWVICQLETPQVQNDIRTKILILREIYCAMSKNPLGYESKVVPLSSALKKSPKAVP